MDLRFVDIPKIENDTLFEDLAKSILNSNNDYNNVNIHGRPGQKQDGVDVYARRVDNSEWIGIQCKVRSTNKSFTKKELLDEINQAQNFNPNLSKYYLYTTLSRDNKTQKIEREINDELSDKFHFEVKFWEDIEDILRRDEFISVYYRYYHKFFKDNLSLGHSIGKLIDLEFGFDNKIDTHYELMIGKIPKIKTEKKVAVNYYRDTYFIVNLHDKKIEFFKKAYKSKQAECFPSDIELAFGNTIDRYRICKWIESIDDFDGFIYDDNYYYEFYIPNSERKEYFENYE